MTASNKNTAAKAKSSKNANSAMPSEGMTTFQKSPVVMTGFGVGLQAKVTQEDLITLGVSMKEEQLARLEQQLLAEHSGLKKDLAKTSSDLVTHLRPLSGLLSRTACSRSTVKNCKIDALVAAYRDLGGIYSSTKATYSTNLLNYTETVLEDMIKQQEPVSRVTELKVKFTVTALLTREDADTGKEIEVMRNITGRGEFQVTEIVSINWEEMCDKYAALDAAYKAIGEQVAEVADKLIKTRSAIVQTPRLHRQATAAMASARLANTEEGKQFMKQMQEQMAGHVDISFLLPQP